jgi:hypothetical protein
MSVAARAAVFAVAIPAIVGASSTAAGAAHHPCGSLTREAACDEGSTGLRARTAPTFHTYVVTLVAEAGQGPTTRTCDGGRALESRDTYVVDGFVDFLALSDGGVAPVEDAHGRPVGLKTTEVNNTGTTIKFHLQCTDDRAPGHVP